MANLGYSSVLNIDAQHLFSDTSYQMVVNALSEKHNGKDPASYVEMSCDYLAQSGIRIKDSQGYFSVINRTAKIDLDLTHSNVKSYETLVCLMLLMLKSIPIVTVSSSKDEGIQLKDWSGMYFPEGNFILKQTHIEIYTDVIWGNSEAKAKDAHNRKKGEDVVDAEERIYTFECAMTLLHELAHAVMDPFNYRFSVGNEQAIRDNIAFFNNIVPKRRHNCPITSGTIKKRYECGGDETKEDLDRCEILNFYVCREESLAESIMHRIITSCNKGKILNNIVGGKKTVIRDIASKRPQYHLATYMIEYRHIDRISPIWWLRMKIDAIVTNNAVTVRSVGESWLDAALDYVDNSSRDNAEIVVKCEKYPI